MNFAKEAKCMEQNLYGFTIVSCIDYSSNILAS
jgi:hypothetical protein